ncbi:hypothetical protein GF361_01635 [Candidatus Woesearchaeota archaeon]|nr:hypothetical protein [Candidatus Woesearchaeota archaeon]
MFLVKCPHCKQNMKYQKMKGYGLKDKRKRCVYCGRSFKIKGNILKSIKDN